MIYARYFQKLQLNDTSDLEARVTELEDDMAIVQTGITILGDDLEDLENSDALQDQRLNNIDTELNIIHVDISNNENNIHGNWAKRAFFYSSEPRLKFEFLLMPYVDALCDVDFACRFDDAFIAEKTQHNFRAKNRSA